MICEKCGLPAEFCDCAAAEAFDHRKIRRIEITYEDGDTRVLEVGDLDPEMDSIIVGFKVGYSTVRSYRVSLPQMEVKTDG